MSRETTVSSLVLRYPRLGTDQIRSDQIRPDEAQCSTFFPEQESFAHRARYSPVVLLETACRLEMQCSVSRAWRIASHCSA